MSEDSDALIREIEEEVRREKLAKLWDQYGTYVIGGLAAVVVLVGAWQWYTIYQRDRAQAAGGQFHEAVALLEGKKKSDGIAGLEQIAKQGTPAYAALAKLRLAAEKREAGKADEAIALYTAVADDASADALFRSFASLQIASLKVDSGSWTEVQNRLNDLAAETSPWRYTARELLGLAAYKHKKWAEAQEAYATLLGDQAAPQDVKIRAQTALALITREQVGAKAEKQAQPGAAKTDLKNDKSAGEGAKSNASADKPKPKTDPALSNGAGAKNDADTKK